MSGQMTDQQVTPDAVRKTRTSDFTYDMVAGTTRCVARLASSDQNFGLKAIWRNEVGSAQYGSGASA